MEKVGVKSKLEVRHTLHFEVMSDQHNAWKMFEKPGYCIQNADAVKNIFHFLLK